MNSAIVSAAWVTITDFAKAADISLQAARTVCRNALNGIAWRDATLVVRTSKGRGGRSGISYEISICSMPLPIQQAFGLSAKKAVESRIEVTAADARLQAILGIIKHPIKSAKRSVAIKHAAVQLGISERAIRLIVAKYLSDGFGALTRKSRNDKGSRRVRFWRSLDNALSQTSLTSDELDKLEETIVKIVKTQWARGAASAKHVANFSAPQIARLIQDTNCGLPAAHLLRIAMPPRNFVSRYARAAKLHRAKHDAGTFAARNIPRIRRDRSMLLPMDCIATDVAHFDIALRRADGSLATPKLVAFQDLATNRIHWTAFLLDKGEGIRQAHVLEAFARLVSDPQFGMPRAIYADNGSEFGWLELAGKLIEHSIHVFDIASNRSPIQRAQPYNPQAKVIESSFAAIKRSVEPHFIGYLGGDRMKKKVENQGRAPTPYPGDFDAFVSDLSAGFNYFHALGQSGHLDGYSPRKSYDNFVQGGWRSTIITAENLPSYFCRSETRIVGSGGTLKVAGDLYYADALSLMDGERVEVRVPLYGNFSGVVVRDSKGEFICVAQQETYYAFNDPAGALEQKRRKKAQRHMLAAMQAETSGSGADVSAMRDATAFLSGEIAPQPATVITLSGQLSQEGQSLLAGPKRKNSLPTRHNDQIQETRMLARSIRDARKKVAGGE